MPAGFEAWDENGNITLQMTFRIPRIVDIRDITISSPNVWVAVTGLELASFKDYAVVPLSMRVNGFATTESWMLSEKIAGGYRVTTFRGNNISFKVAVMGY